MLNKTKCPDSILRPIVEHAQRMIGNDDCQVVIRQSRRNWVRGLATRRGWGTTSADAVHLVELWLPKKCLDAIESAYHVWECLMHEFGHVLDYQALDRGETRVFTYYRNLYSRRKIKHDSRPQEQRAYQYVKEAKQKIIDGAPGCDSDIFTLAEWFLCQSNNY